MNHVASAACPQSAIAVLSGPTFAHEVGTPLNLVNGHLQLMEGQKDLPDRVRERLGVIQAHRRNSAVDSSAQLWLRR